MSKITINLSLKNGKENYCKKNIKGTLNSNKLVFIDNNIMTTITLDKVIKIKRSCNEYTLCFNLDSKKDTVCAYYINDSNLNLKIRTLKLDVKDNYIYAKYILEEDVIELEIDYEVI